MNDDAGGKSALSAWLGPLAPMEQLLAFVDWERKHRPHHDDKPHIAEWAASEIERLAELADSEGTRAVECLRRARNAEAETQRLRAEVARVARAAKDVTEGADDTGEDFIVPSHLMAALALALDEGPNEALSR